MARKSPTISYRGSYSGAVRTVNVVSVGPGEQDSVSLRSIFEESDWGLCPNSEWRLHTFPTADRALAALEKCPVSVLFCACDQNPDAWKDVLQKLAPYSDPPFVIVTSRMADDRLWSEALNLGAYDVLAKPFDRNEVIRVVSMAWLRWADRSQRSFSSVA